jgi:DNA-binding winged helix-turn-helix (wHTH) protein
MTALENGPYLLILLSTEPKNERPRVYLTSTETYLGRPEKEELSPSFINLAYPWISRKQARIFQCGAEYVLENCSKRNDIRLYEIILRTGESRMLKHGYQFRVPDSADPQFLITFCLGQETMQLALRVDQRAHKVRVFGKDVHLTPHEYYLVKYLYDHAEDLCYFDDIIAYIWAESKTDDAIQPYLTKLQSDRHEFDERREALDVLLAKVRQKFREASGGMSFIETVRSEGLRLIL